MSMASTLKVLNLQLSPTWCVMSVQFTREVRRSQHVEDDLTINLFLLLTDYYKIIISFVIGEQIVHSYSVDTPIIHFNLYYADP
jgi:hypothetical protein